MTSIRALLGAILVCIGAATVLRAICGLRAEALYAGGGEAQDLSAAT